MLFGRHQSKFSEISDKMDERGTGTLYPRRSLTEYSPSILENHDEGIEREEEAYIISPCEIDDDDAKGKAIPEPLQKLLEDYAYLCQAPTVLPPKKDLDHAINLKEGATIPNIRPTVTHIAKRMRWKR